MDKSRITVATSSLSQVSPLRLIAQTQSLSQFPFLLLSLVQSRGLTIIFLCIADYRVAREDLALLIVVDDDGNHEWTLRSTTRDEISVSILSTLLKEVDTRLVFMRYFEYACIYCSEYYELIPVPFVLGFYVSLVVGRWWDQFLVLPWPDQLALYLTAFCDGNDEPAIRIRRTVVRYANLSYCLALRAISSRARLRFPTEEHLVLAGLMTSEELEMYANTPPVEYTLYFAPLVWAMDIVNKARKEGHIQSDHAVEVLTAEITSFRGKLGTIFAYDWVNPPLVYTQTATIVVYSYCAAALLAWQHLDPNREYANHKIDIYVPIFGLLRFFFYIGWLKVAESLINPFGEDVDDFEIEYLIERNLNISYLIVDGMHREHPDLVRDAFWDSVNVTLPKRPESAGHGETATTQVDDDEREKIVSASRLTGSLANLDLPERRPSLALWNRTTVSRVPSNSSHREN
ncbi:unnamed protein product [Calicophoron daubneyi]|uniref:Bestrophin homolog n=1 Tax=Calicophoron daubneyi TaxID=300641 RepID=A0AAV2T9Q4_CALDB